MLSVIQAIKAVGAHLSSARELAVKEKRPTDQIVSLQGDLDASSSWSSIRSGTSSTNSPRSRRAAAASHA
jgi:hypothetical protein